MQENQCCKKWAFEKINKINKTSSETDKNKNRDDTNHQYQDQSRMTTGLADTKSILNLRT